MLALAHPPDYIPVWVTLCPSANHPTPLSSAQGIFLVLENLSVPLTTGLKVRLILCVFPHNYKPVPGDPSNIATPLNIAGRIVAQRTINEKECELVVYNDVPNAYIQRAFLRARKRAELVADFDIARAVTERCAHLAHTDPVQLLPWPCRPPPIPRSQGYRDRDELGEPTAGRAILGASHPQARNQCTAPPLFPSTPMFSSKHDSGPICSSAPATALASAIPTRSLYPPPVQQIASPSMLHPVSAHINNNASREHHPLRLHFHPIPPPSTSAAASSSLFPDRPDSPRNLPQAFMMQLFLSPH
ncbi:hypothetical protein GY45DRAFT_1009032 [Cubamyces sp. BRFM 1775]|nr:hypothetical protein GY45DRAFT_1009032 [Cubamyces sp. BRFM 1775]